MVEQRLVERKDWRITIKVDHKSGIFKRPSRQHYLFHSDKPINAYEAMKRFEKRNPIGAVIIFKPRTPKQKNACQVFGNVGFVASKVLGCRVKSVI